MSRLAGEKLCEMTPILSPRNTVDHPKTKDEPTINFGATHEINIAARIDSESEETESTL